MARSVRFSAVDAAWLHMETPTNSAMITGVYMFDEPIDWKRFRETIECRLLKYDRFRMRVREPLLPLGLPRWEFDPHFSLDAHLHRIALPAPGGQQELHDLVGDLMSTSLDFTKPLWQMHLVENFGSGCAVVSRLHHCIADGLALVQVMLSTTDCEADAPLSAAPAANARATRPRKSMVPGMANVTRTLRTAENLLYDGLDTLTDPARAVDLAELGAGGTRALGKLILTLPDSKTLFRGNCGIPKRAAWTRAIPLQDVKAVGKAYEGTINDVLISCVAGALGRYLEGRKQDIGGLNIRAMFPVNLRKPDELDELGNRFGLVILSLPIGVKDPAKRLQIVKKRMDEIKNSPEAIVAFGLLNGMGLAPQQVEKLLLRFFAAKVTAVMTNVPGPREPLYFAGRPIRGQMFWVPTPGNLGLGVSIISYAGEVTVGVATDAGLVPDPQTIVTMFEQEVERMLAAIQPPRPALPPAAAAVTPAVARKNGRERRNGQPARTCEALTKTGEPCKNHVPPGSAFCARHAAAHEKVRS